MARKVTPSQIRNMLRQQQSRIDQAIRRYNQEVDRVNRANKAAYEKVVRDHSREVNRVNQQNKRVVDGLNREIRQHNRNQRAAVTKYNQAVRNYNAAVQRDRQRRLSALNVLSSARYTEVRSSTFELNESFERIERSSTAYADLLVLSEKEASNSAMVAETLLTDGAEIPDAPEDTGILEYLQGFSQDLCDRWRGAMHAMSPTNPDAARHFCTSVREIFSEILTRWADDDDVVSDDPDCDRTQQGTPSRRAKIRYLLRKKGADTPEMLGFVDKDIEDILQLFPVFNKATHGVAGALSFASLKALRQRVEGGIMFLAAVAL